jgi:hypothetical protein
MIFTAEFYRLVRHEFVRNAIVIVIALTVFAWVLDATFPEDSVTESKHPLAGAQKPSKGLSAEPICYHLTDSGRNFGRSETKFEQPAEPATAV